MTLDSYEMDMMEEAILQDLQLEIFRENYEFQMWLEQNRLYVNEDTLMSGNQGIMQWRINLINDIKQNLVKVAQFALSQQLKESKFLMNNKNILTDLKTYPPKKTTMMTNASNYEAAIQRLTIPLTSSIGNIDFTKIEASSDKKSNIKNLAIKKAIIPAYDGQSNFKQFAKNYFSGAEGKRVTIDHIHCAPLIPIAFRYCMTYETRLKNADPEIKQIIAYINTDPQNGQTQNLNQMQQNIQQMQNQKQMKNMATMGQMASTNPAANIGASKPINAAYNFEDDMNYYFGEEDWNKPNWLNEGANDNKNPMGKPLSSNTPKGDSKVVNKPVNVYRRHQIVCNFLKDALDGKLTAMGLLYRDFLYLCKTHITSYQKQNPMMMQNNIMPQQQMPSQ